MDTIGKILGNKKNKAVGNYYKCPKCLGEHFTACKSKHGEYDYKCSCGHEWAD